MKNRPIYGRIPVDYAPIQDLSIDIKTMPQAFGGYHLLLVITCDQTNFTIAVPLRDRTAQTIAEALISLHHSVNGDFCGHSRFVLWHENLTTFVS